MSKPPPLGHRFSEDPVGSHLPRGKDCSQRKSGRDGPSWTPTEQRTKDRLMRQFVRYESGPGLGNTDAYRSSELWCRNCAKGRAKLHGYDVCAVCLEAAR